ncbi:MAG: hypothetical protein ABWY47_03410 [Xanthobacteraceae bacterium]|jgi:hypothetical protein
MAQLAFIVVVLALAGALASWVAGAWFYAQTLRELAAERGQPRLAWLAVVAWPFATGRIKGAAAARAAQVNKALVAFLACLMVALAATSVATNLARVSR